MSDALRQQLQTSLGATYTLGRELGGGGMSRVFVATDEQLAREVVIKVLAPELAQGISVERFEREIRLAARLQEPHIVPVLAAGTTTDGLPYYAMPFVRGESLRARIARGSLPLAEAVGVLRDVARALAYAHGQGIVHRDIKPENVLLNEGTAVVTDFGIAKAIALSATHAPDGRTVGESSRTLTQFGIALGSPAYMSPEQATGETVDQRADLYAWGVTAYELLAGHHPFVGKATAQQLLAAHLTEVAPVAAMHDAGVPRMLAALVMRCLEKDPARRPAAVGELFAVLDSIPPSSVDAVAQWHAATPAVRRALPLLALGVVLMGVAVVVAHRRAERPSHDDVIRSIAVLPFENIGGDSVDAYLAHGLTDELIVALGTLPEMRVAPRVTAQVLHARGLTASDIARALDVQGVLAGTVRRAGDRLRVTSELVHASSGRRVWSEQIEENRGDVFAVEDRITRAIVGAIRLRLSGSEMPRLAAARGTADAEAYDLYLRGRYFWSLRSEDGLRRAVDYFRRAAGRDSDYVLAISGLADAYAVSAFYSYVPPREGFGHAKELAQRALRLDSTRAEAHASLGYIALYYDWDWAEAERRFRRAIQLDSSYATAHQWYGNYLVAMNRPSEAIASLRRAQRADPLNRVAVGAVCWGLYMIRRYEEAVVQCSRAVELDSTFAPARLWGGQSLAMLEDTVRAFRELDAAAALSGQSTAYVAALAQSSASAGRTQRARNLLADLTMQGHRYVPPYEIALVYAALGERERAIKWLERAYQERSHSIAFLRVDPALDPLRSDGRFMALLERTGAR